MFKEFKQFIMRGNVLDLAVAVIIGAAFGRIVTSLVNDVIMPPIGLVTSHVDFNNLFIDLSGQNHPTLAAAKAAGAATINYGVFLNTIIDFVIVAFVIFLVVQTGQQAQSETCSGRAQHQGLRLLLHQHSAKGYTLSELHFAIGVVRIRQLLRVLRKRRLLPWPSPTDLRARARAVQLPAGSRRRAMDRDASGTAGALPPARPVPPRRRTCCGPNCRLDGYSSRRVLRFVNHHVGALHELGVTPVARFKNRIHFSRLRRRRARSSSQYGS